MTDLESKIYELHLKDKAEKVVTIEVIGLDEISTRISEVKLDGIKNLFSGINTDELCRPTDGEIDCLIGYQYAAFHPVMQQASGHLLVLQNRFGKVIGGSHPCLKENTRKIVQHATVNHISASIEAFYSLETLGVECNSKCEGC